ncbi:hypothetical protein Srot_0066 [Segniliparus rotundus DSM 44985]|uniref:Scaffolding protein n=1 Tax=Segniliparus rotundus (strain ATCC BAA-972 / CDC 1076 / CIP 108378 / DSM 44985 / JCM 13578) TaxID=640132 RepID=D6Z9N2_SEGRD|nr:hypothetical protein [Segniliparus rotundus]ADG96559.1 hypothetical protein Srot_0066 [Segniliparus rotundus DSM 44985]
MSEPIVEAAEAPETEADEPKPKQTETVDFWKSKARDWESKAKSNKSAADELAALKDSQKTEAERAAEKLANAEAEAATVPVKVAGALKAHLVALHGISDEDAELFLTAQDPELLLKQAARLVGNQSGVKGNKVPHEGANPRPKPNSTSEFLGALTGAG